MAMLAILAACHKYFACGNKVLFCSVLRSKGRSRPKMGRKTSTLPHVWSPALDGATTYRLFSGSCTGFQSANEFNSSWPC